MPMRGSLEGRTIGDTEERAQTGGFEGQSGLDSSVSEALPSDPSADESLRLAVAAKAGDEDAIERLWTLHESELHVYLSRYLRDPRDVAEAAQEVFIRMLRGLPGYEPDGTPFRFWLFRIARNYSIDVLRREKHSQVEDQDRLNRLREAAAAAGASDEGWLDDERMAGAVEELPLEQQRTLLLRFGFGMKSEEVAQVLGISPAAVRQQQSRALRRLQESLAANGA
jgi:RNA polymerase sigma-70 factor (ECF subfamily)